MTETGVDFWDLVNIEPYDINDPEQLRLHIERLAKAPVPKTAPVKGQSKRIRPVELSDEELQAAADELGVSLDEMKLTLAKAKRAMKITSGRGD